MQPEVYFSHTWVKEEFERWLALSGETDPYDSDDTLGLRDVLRAHFLIIDFFADGGQPIGGVGPKSLELLHSAIYRQFVAFGSTEKWPSSIDKCATLLYGITKDHAFHDANKRTAMLSTLLFLQKKCVNRIPIVGDKDLEDFLVEVADDQLSRYPRYRELLKKSDHDPEVKFIADWLRRNSRPVDKRSYEVTYHQLSGILNSFGFGLENPRGNFIDLVRYEKKRTMLGLGPVTNTAKRIAHIGFPGWKGQVSKKTLKDVREATKLTAERGYDSQNFFKGVDPLYSLINRYAEPLKRLADR